MLNRLGGSAKVELAIAKNASNAAKGTFLGNIGFDLSKVAKKQGYSAFSFQSPAKS
jgi:hypothetical protein